MSIKAIDYHTYFIGADSHTIPILSISGDNGQGGLTDLLDGGWGSTSLEPKGTVEWFDENGELIEDYEPPSHPTPPNSKWVEIEIGSEIKVRDLTYITISGQYYESTLQNSSSDFTIGLRFWSYFKLLNL